MMDKIYFYSGIIGITVTVGFTAYTILSHLL